MAIPFLKVKRCCFCTKKLKVACLLIAIWSMFSSSHSTAIVFGPVCTNYQEHLVHNVARVLKWILFIINMITISCSFAFILGLFWSWPVTADLFMAFGFISGIVMLVYGIVILIQLYETGCPHFSDVIVYIIYFLLWMYFIVVVNSHRDNMRKS